MESMEMPAKWKCPDCDQPAYSAKRSLVRHMTGDKGRKPNCPGVLFKCPNCAVPAFKSKFTLNRHLNGGNGRVATCLGSRSDPEPSASELLPAIAASFQHHYQTQEAPVDALPHVLHRLQGLISALEKQPIPAQLCAQWNTSTYDPHDISRVENVATNIDTSVNYIVREVIDHRYEASTGKLQFKLNWANTWEYASNVDADILVNDYYKKLQILRED